MVKRDREQVRERLHDQCSEVVKCSLPTKEDLESIYWMDFPQFFVFGDKETSFTDDIPDRVKNSYLLWKKTKN